MLKRSTVTIILKSVAAGILSALLVCILVISVRMAVALPPLWALARRSGSGGIGSFSILLHESEIYAGLLTGFAIGFYWQFKRASRLELTAK